MHGAEGKKEKTAQCNGSDEKWRQNLHSALRRNKECTVRGEGKEKCTVQKERKRKLHSATGEMKSGDNACTVR
ncbi:unnamed protein product [Bursaphelenchus xylophilus]|uniref:(pine wood nematode) hypothetical protein n=1 Tax=Bursaphelenchus xylophilus TaxID=6326 RepID=A0A1I7SCC8_BURXY|nr:unnamed protein product [Bursaphelenchus xylophilus]CAG9094339.1 unnamed protein product [Bursaphelenchus xylophilus]